MYGGVVHALRMNSVFTAHSMGTAFNSSEKSKSKDNIPVVYMWLGKAMLPEYFEHIAKASARHNDVIVLVEERQRFEHDISSRISFVDLKPVHFEKDVSFFTRNGKGDYQHWGLHEPWEQHNLQRVFVLNSWMADLTHYDRVFFADSDVAVLSNVLQLWDEQYRDCDSAMALEKQQKVSSMKWAAWIGSGFLNRRILDEFEQFTKQMYSGTYIHHLETKKNVKPFVCDMTLWYLFAAAAGVYQDAHNQLILPMVSANVSATSICDTTSPRGAGHFDYMLGFKKHGFEIGIDGASYLQSKGERIRLHSLHFQGNSKKDAAKVLSKY